MSSIKPTRTRIGLQDQNGGITDDFILVTATINDNHQSELKITSNPTERGSEVMDHSYLSPRSITVRALFTGSAGGALLDGSDAQGPTETDVTAWERLKNYQRANTLCYLTTTLEVYKDMAIEKLSVNRDWRTGQALKVTITFRQILIVDAKREETQVALRPLKKQVAKKEADPVDDCVAKSKTKRSQAHRRLSSLLGVSEEEIAAEDAAKAEENRVDCQVELSQLAEHRNREEDAGQSLPQG